jgi:hypothetical protein
MSYTRLSPRQKQAVDALISGQFLIFASGFRGNSNNKAIGRTMGVSENAAKTYISQAGRKYGIPRQQWCVAVRLCYLRAKELGML